MTPVTFWGESVFPSREAKYLETVTQIPLG
jgi:hypothetical protein